MPPLPRGTLSTPKIVDAAIRLIDADGLQLLTMRRLAQELGCEAMSLYKHVADKDMLLALVIERVMDEFVPPNPRLGWRNRLRAIAAELRRLALAHPHLFPLIAVQLPTSPAALAPVDAALAALTDAGLPDDRAVGAFWALVAYVTGALLAETAAVTGAVQPFPFGLPAGGNDAHPHVTRMSARLAASDYATEFDRGLNLLLDSIATTAR